MIDHSRVEAGARAGNAYVIIQETGLTPSIYPFTYLTGKLQAETNSESFHLFAYFYRDYASPGFSGGRGNIILVPTWIVCTIEGDLYNGIKWGQ